MAHSEDVLQGELDSASIARAEDASELRCVRKAVGKIEIRVVENVEELGAELQSALFGEAKVLEEAEVEVHRSRTKQEATACVAERELRRDVEGGCVEPSLRLRVVQLPLSHEIRP